MKQRIYPRIVKGDENEVDRNEILWIEHKDGTVDLKKINTSGKLVSIVKTDTPTPEEPVALSIEEPETPTKVEETPKTSAKTTTKNILD